MKSRLENRMQSSSGMLELQFQIARSGLPYFYVTWSDVSGRRQQVPVFGTELEWLGKSLAVLADRLEPQRFRVPGYYPLLGSLSAGGGLAWELRVDDQGQRRLCLCRFNVKKTKASDVFFGRYFLRARRGRFAQQAPVSSGFIEDGSLALFAKSYAQRMDTIRANLIETLPRNAQTPIDLFSQVVVEGRLCLPTDNTLEQGIVLERPMPRIALLACESACAATDLAKQLPISASQMSNLLDYTARYSQEVLAAGLLYAPRLERECAVFQAVSDRDTYRVDPLLTALDPTFDPPEDQDSDAEWVRVRQCTSSAFERELDLGRACDEFPCAWGRAPYPEAEEGEKIRLLYRSHSSIRRFRWKLLQLLWRGVAEATNFPGGLEGDPVLEHQRLSLLRWDVANHFDDGSAGAALDLASHRIVAMRSGANSDPMIVNEWTDLPRSTK